MIYTAGKYGLGVIRQFAWFGILVNDKELTLKEIGDIYCHYCGGEFIRDKHGEPCFFHKKDCEFRNSAKFLCRL